MLQKQIKNIPKDIACASVAKASPKASAAPRLSVLKSAMKKDPKKSSKKVKLDGTPDLRTIEGRALAAAMQLAAVASSDASSVESDDDNVAAAETMVAAWAVHKTEDDAKADSAPIPDAEAKADAAPIPDAIEANDDEEATANDANVEAGATQGDIEM